MPTTASTRKAIRVFIRLALVIWNGAAASAGAPASRGVRARASESVRWLEVGSGVRVPPRVCGADLVPPRRRVGKVGRADDRQLERSAVRALEDECSPGLFAAPVGRRRRRRCTPSPCGRSRTRPYRSPRCRPWRLTALLRSGRVDPTQSRRSSRASPARSGRRRPWRPPQRSPTCDTRRRWRCHLRPRTLRRTAAGARRVLRRGGCGVHRPDLAHVASRDGVAVE